MMNMTGMVRAQPGKWLVAMKPAGPRKGRPDFLAEVFAATKTEAESLAHLDAGPNYKVVKTQEIRA